MSCLSSEDRNNTIRKEVEIMFCENCGKELVGSNAFCTNCGAAAGRTSKAAQLERKAVNSMQNGTMANSTMPNSTMVHAGSVSVREEHAPEAKIVMWICSVLSMLATFLPFITASAFGFSQSVTMAESDGAAVFIYLLSAITIVLAIFPRARKFSIIPAVLVLLYLLAVMVTANDSMGYGESAGMGIGFWIMALGNITILVEAIRYRRAK